MYFEGYGPYGIAIFVECTTSNFTHIIANIRAIFNRGSGNLGKKGAMDFISNRKGFFYFKNKIFENHWKILN
ncbi:YebC/PmpR family DNA-binding transcriptional regulator [Bacteroidetes bacterium endosymbiont of Geopemphigus sp.]|uniref:YebC/PmpR family DNA-binding transcriptional regulator n=1 Tax=Bacteroidetes bacterium endosymbiont of Geopemphigus sp. TaxID=2047937 RepID=UPI003D2F57BD